MGEGKVPKTAPGPNLPRARDVRDRDDTLVASSKLGSDSTGETGP
jgi:hypothetical protein